MKALLEKYKQTKWHRGWVKLGEDLKPMTWKERIEHIFMYYKEVMLVILALIVALSAVITMSINSSKEVLVSGMIINLSLKQEGYNYMQSEYLEVLAPGEKNKDVQLDATNFGDILDAENGEFNYNASMTFIARVSGQMLDYAIMDKFAMEYYITQDAFLDLREFFTEAELAEMDAAKKIIYVQVEETGKRWPVAVDISDIPFVKDNVTTEGPIYFVFSGNIRNIETYRNIWDRLHAWESEPAA